jgi:SPW repeat
MTTEAINMHPDHAALRTEHETVTRMPVVSAVGGLVLLTGLYLAISPWVVGFDRLTTLTGNNLIVGVALAVLGLGLAAAPRRTQRLAWVPPLIGVWTIIAPWVVHGPVTTTATTWSNVVTGVVAVLLSVGAMSVRLAPAD